MISKKYKRAEITKHFTSGEIVKNAREMLEMTQKELSKKTGIPQAHISEIERGKRVVGKGYAETLAKAIEVPPSFILFAGEETRFGAGIDMVKKVKKFIDLRDKVRNDLRVVIKYTRSVEKPALANEMREVLSRAIDRLEQIRALELLSATKSTTQVKKDKSNQS